MWRSIALWRKPLPGAQSIAADSPSTDFPTERRTRFHTAGCIAHGSSDNVLPIASTSRIFATSPQKNGDTVEFREFSGGHHLSHQVAEQAMSWLATAFQQHRSGKMDRRHG